jgi:hypothetical protein
MMKKPFMGLNPYSKDDAAFFFGRDGSSGSVVETVLDDTFCFSCIR